MARIELCCVGVATLLRNKIMQAYIERFHKAIHCCLNCQDFYFIVKDICLALTTAQAKNLDIALAGYNLGKDKLKS